MNLKRIKSELHLELTIEIQNAHVEYCRTSRSSRIWEIQIAEDGTWIPSFIDAKGQKTPEYL